MKKIISLLSVFAMIATLFTTVAFADENNKFYFEETVDGKNVTLTFYVKSNKTINAASGALDLTAAFGACESVTAEIKGASVFNLNTTQKLIAWSYSDTTGFTGVKEMGVLTFVNVGSDFALPQKKAFKAVSGSENITTSFTNEQVGYTVKAPVEDKPELPADRSKAVSFSANENTFVEITKGAEVKNYFLPAGVKGDATVYGLLKYTVDGTNVKSGDVFTIKAVDMETKVATDVASITVE